MEEKDKIIVKWAQEDVETSNNLLNNNNYSNSKIWPVNQILNNMGIRHKKHNYEEEEEEEEEKSVISIQIEQNEYLIRIIHRI